MDKEREVCSRYQSEAGMSDRGKRVNVWGMTILVHGVVFCCGKHFRHWG